MCVMQEEHPGRDEARFDPDGRLLRWAEGSACARVETTTERVDSAWQMNTSNQANLNNWKYSRNSSLEQHQLNSGRHVDSPMLVSTSHLHGLSS